MTDSLLSHREEHALVSSREQPWLSSAGWDSLFILSPAFVSTAAALLLRNQFAESHNLPLWAWVCLVLIVDVAHVYATLFRTYLNRSAFEHHKMLLIAIPATCWAAGSLLYSVDDLLFWRTLAYLAVFHFVRQQYGFVCLYSRKDPVQSRRFAWLDHLTIYVATIYPLLYWHTNLPRNFNWFVDGDFIENVPAALADVGLISYIVVATGYFIKELTTLRATGFINVPRNLIIIGTAISWWVGIVALNSDMAFTMTNVLTHGIPYMALIWLYQGKKNEVKSGEASMSATLSHQAKRSDENAITTTLVKLALAYAPVFFLFLVVLAYLEEGFWDGLVWREHTSLFAPFSHLPAIRDPVVLALLVPLLSLPQSTHYVLDGFIWRVKNRTSLWSA